MPDIALPAPVVDIQSQKSAGPGLKAADVKTREQAAHVAREFERMFIAQMLAPMFEGLETDGPFGGGNAEATFRPMLTDQYAASIARGSGLGVADSIMKEILKMQGLE